MSLVEPMSLLNSVSDDCGLPSLSLVLKQITYMGGLFVFIFITWAFFSFYDIVTFWGYDDGCLCFRFSHVSVALVFI